MICEVKGCIKEANFMIKAQLVAYQIVAGIRKGEPKITSDLPIPNEPENYWVCSEHNTHTAINQLQKKWSLK